ncbi:unnamed protein product, partial [Polarella glacialis]
DLFTRYSDALEQLDSLKSEKQKVVLERDEISRTLDQERQQSEQVRKELEEAEPAGPAQLTVNDVLISVVFDDAAAPLEVKPWDTNFEDVVTNWLATVQRSDKLKPSLVRYLRHLEETSAAFPVRREAKLLEVHEEFAL